VRLETQVGQGLAFDRGDGLPVQGDRVVPARQATAHGVYLLAGEGAGVALVGVDHDLQHLTAGPGGRQRHVRPRLIGGAGGLPEDHLPAPRPGDHEL
jgi:hypothetical protein